MCIQPEISQKPSEIEPALSKVNKEIKELSGEIGDLGKINILQQSYFFI